MDMKAVIIFLILVSGCKIQHKPHISPYGSPFEPRITEARKKELTLYITRELWAQYQLKKFEEKGETK
jgi:hypothetical protein